MLSWNSSNISVFYHSFFSSSCGCLPLSLSLGAYIFSHACLPFPTLEKQAIFFVSSPFTSREVGEMVFFSLPMHAYTYARYSLLCFAPPKLEKVHKHPPSLPPTHYSSCSSYFILDPREEMPPPPSPTRSFKDSQGRVSLGERRRERKQACLGPVAGCVRGPFLGRGSIPPFAGTVPFFWYKNKSKQLFV